MKITAQEEYGLRCMLRLAQAEQDEGMTLPEFARKEGLSIPYAAKLLMILKSAGLVKAIRGRNGGYVLARKADDIPLREVLAALGEPMFPPSYCKEHAGNSATCVRSARCNVRQIWRSLDNFIDRYFEAITLADAASGKAGFPVKTSIPSSVD